jgi:hypothetical protein
MNTKKIILILLLIFSLSFVLTGCSAIGELKTETIVKKYLESDDGPKYAVKQSFNKLLDEFSQTDGLEDYKWKYSINDETVNIVDAKSDSDGSGILTVKNIVLVYDYTITGEHKSDNSKSVSKNGNLYYNIDKLIYDNNSEELIEMNQAKAKGQSKSPVLSKITPNNDNGFILNVEIDEYSSGSVLGVISLGDRDLSDSQSNHDLDISNDQLSIDTEFSLGETNFASILVINYDELIDIDSPLQTGLAAALIAVP